MRNIPFICIFVSFAALMQEEAAEETGGDVAAQVQAALAQFSHEPACNEVVKTATAFSQKEKKVKIASKKTIRASALLPLLRFSITKNLEYDESVTLVEDDDTALKIYTDDDLKFKITLQWDLASLVFNTSEPSVISREQAEAKWKLELKQTVIQVYYQRRKLQVLLLIMGDSLPPETIVEWSLQIEELAALLDALTGDWFSGETEKRKKKKQ